MATFRFEPHGTTVAWANAGAINLELSPKPFTITGLYLDCQTDISTTTATNFNDYWDRFLTNLSLSGMGQTFFNFTDCRMLYHAMRVTLGGFTPPRPAPIANSGTNVLTQFGIDIPFGIKPYGIDPATGTLRRLPQDLSAGIPPTGSGNLTLAGTFGGTNALGTNVTLNVTANCQIVVYVYGLQADRPGEDISPKALPNWQMSTPTFSGTTGAFGSSVNVPAGDFLHDIIHMTYRGTNNPRDDQVFNSYKLYNQLEARDIVRYGGQSGNVRDAKIAEMVSQNWSYNQWPPSDDNSTMAVQSINRLGPSDYGIIHLPVGRWTNIKNGYSTPYGLDLRTATTGDLQQQFGLNNNTSTTHNILYRKYKPL